jgi:transcriptional regulator GlxA family with amidase domain
MTEGGAGSKHIGILLFNGVEELDAVGPYEVLAFWTQSRPEDGYTVSTFSIDGADVKGAKGLVLGAQHSLDTLPELDVLVHPGGFGTRRLMRDADHLDWIRHTHESVSLMTSVCTGSLVFAAAGLLSHRPATTYWSAMDTLHELDPTIERRVDDRYVDDGDIITSAGVSAGIDMALHLVLRLAGADRAREVKRGIQYEPEPPV